MNTCENQSYQNFQKNNYQQVKQRTYTNSNASNQTQKRKNSQYQNYNQTSKQNYQNFSTNTKTNQPLNNNKNDYSESENLLLNDVYGKKSSTNNFENSSKENCSDYSNCNNDFDYSSILKTFFQNSENVNNNENIAMPDIETILKFKKIFERLNSKNATKDPIINLLIAFKPFMQESKKSIIDQLTKFMTISTALQDFNSFL